MNYIDVKRDLTSSSVDDAYFTELFSKAEVISFDIFDTLLVRPFANPVDVFALIERREAVKGFGKARIQAETTAREKAFRKTKSHEVTLKQIYQELSVDGQELKAALRARLMQAEIETERSILTPSPTIRPLYNLARVLGKTVIATSDMYIPSDVMTDILVAKGYELDHVFMSCDIGRSKHEGGLFLHVAKTLGCELSSILHVGDNMHSDGAAALKVGVAGFYIPSLFEQVAIDQRFNQQAFHELALQSRGVVDGNINLASSIVVAFLSLAKAKNPAMTLAEQFGAMYAGPLVSGFAVWLDAMAKTENVRHLRLATRDGYITKAVWDRLGLDPERASVFQSSRRLTMIPVLCTAFESELPSLIGASSDTTMRQCIKRLDLGEGEEELLQILQRFTPLDRPIDTETRRKAALKALRDCRAALLQIAQSERAAYARYMEDVGFDPSQDAFVDCGWALTTQKRMEKMIKQRFRGFYVGSLGHAHSHTGIHAFLFHKGDERTWVDIIERGVELVELAFASNNLQVCRFQATSDGADVEPVMVEQAKQYDVIRSVFINRMHEETLAFAEFIKPFIDVITIDEFRETLTTLFRALVLHPTASESHSLSILPHNRELGASGFSTIGSFWCPLGEQARIVMPSWGAYFRVGWHSLPVLGIAGTLREARRVVRKKLRFR